LYTALYCAFGVVSPFLPAYFEDQGLTSQEIAFVIGLGTAIRLASGPLIGRLADRQRRWRGTLSVCAAGAGVMALAYLPVGSFGPILLVSLIQSAFLAPLAPIADAMALSASLPTTGKGFDIVFDTVGGATLDSSFMAVKRHTGHVVSCLGWGTHSLAPLSMRGATYSGVFTLLPLITGEGRAHHGEILAHIAALAETAKLKPLVNDHVISVADIDTAHVLVETGAIGNVVVELGR